MKTLKMIPATVMLIVVLLASAIQAGDSGSSRTFTASGAITALNLVKVVGANQVSQAGNSDEAIGVALQTTADQKLVDVKLLRPVVSMTASGAITAAANVYPDVTGLVSATAGTGRRIGIALNATTNSGDICDVVLMFAPDVAAGGAAATLLPEGIISVQASSTGVGTGADTTEDVLYTYSLPASALAAKKGVRITAFGTTGATANNKTVKVYFGATSYTTGAAAANAKPWEISATVLKTGSAGSNTQICSFKGNFNATQLAPGTSAATETESGAIVIKVTGTNGTAAANDILANGLLIEFLN